MSATTSAFDFQPRDHLDEAEVQHGLKLLLVDGIASQVMTSLTGGAFLVAYALLLGASNTVIGLIASIAPLTQILQVPAIYLIEITRRRKLLAVVAALFSRTFWLLIAALPWLGAATDTPMSIPVLMLCLTLYSAFGTVQSCAFNSWKRDIVPEPIMGRYLAKRLTIATALSAVLTLSSGVLIDRGTQLFASALTLYSALFAVGALFGFIGAGALAKVPEPRMSPRTGDSLVRLLLEPLRDGNFRKLLMFLGSWNFAVNLAMPFFTVYMIKTLELPMAWVIGFSVSSQVANVAFYRIWGRLADRFSNKSVMSVSGSLFIVTIALWTFTTLPGKYVLTLPLLVLIHVLSGVSTAGVNLSAAGLALKSAPKGKATAFLAVNAIISGTAATIAPILAGIASDHFAEEHLSIDLHWLTGAIERAHITAIDLQGLDFIFVIAFVFGLYALHRLLAVSEQGEVEEDVVIGELYGEVAQLVRKVSNVPGGAVKGVTGVMMTTLRSSTRQRPGALEAEITQELPNPGNAVKR